MLEQLSHYKILDRIGAGGMGEVYRARDTRLGRTVAIKVLPDAVAGDPDRRERFMREARATASLSHPNIAALFEIGEDQGRLFLVFEYVPGQPLSTEIGGRPINPRQAIHFAIQIADALADAHGEGIIHRDIKPDNVVITPKGNAKVLDFGLAKWTAGGEERERAATAIQTGAGAAIGTVAYMSPEQALGEPVDARTDLFSLGIVLHEMLTGVRPFQGATATATALQIVQAQPPAPSSVDRNVPRELDTIVSRALAKKLDARYASAAALSAELRAIDAILDVRSQASERETAIVTAARPRRAVVRWFAATVVIVAVVGGVWLVRDSLFRMWRRTFGPPPAPIVAVIPLELEESDRSKQYFADGLTDDIVSRLGQTAGIRVLGRSATRNYRGRTPHDLARELGASVVLTGTVRPSGDTVRVSLELVNPTDSTALWTGQYTQEVRSIFAVQSQVADDVAAALRVKLQPTAARARTAARLVDQKAYDAYLRGRQAAAQRNLAEAKLRFQQAIALDDGLAEAYAGLAEAIHLESAFLGAADDAARTAQLRRAAERAIELDPDLPQANLAAGLVADRLVDALDRMKKAIANDPTYSEAYHQIGDQIADFDPQRAMAFYRHALALDPHMEINRTDLVSVLALLGRFDEARAVIDASTGAGDTQWKLPAQLILASDQRHFEEVLALLGNSSLLNEVPSLGVTIVNVKRTVGRADEAYREALALVGRMPHNCQAIASLAGLRSERGQTALARQMVAPAIAAGEVESAAPSVIRCAASSSAAIGDATAAARLLRRIAASEMLLRGWATDITGTTGSKVFRRNLFPWLRVSDQPAVVEARAVLDAAYVAKREEIKASLDAVTPRSE